MSRIREGFEGPLLFLEIDYSHELIELNLYLYYELRKESK
jgi:hypothetical protein